VNDERISAHLDGELTPSESAEFERMLATDPALRADYDDLARVRSLLQSSSVEPVDGAIERLIAAVESDDEDRHDHHDARVISLTSRRRVPTFAAAAAAMVIIASVVGGLGGSTNLPALGDLIDQHEAAAAIVDGDPMPDSLGVVDSMPMSVASAAAPPMPDDYSMEHAFTRGRMVHLVYRTVDGDPVSIFRHEGDADLGDLGQGSIVSSEEADMWSAPMDNAYVAVVDGTGYVWIIISAEPHDDMMGDMMHDLPTRSPSLGDRVRDAADAVVEPFRL